MVGVPSRIFDGASHQASLGRHADRFGYDFGRISEASLQVGGNGQVGCAYNGARMGKRLVAGQLAVFAPDGSGRRRAAGGQGLESQAGKDAGRADVPWIGNDEDFRAVVERAKTERLLMLADTHEEPRGSSSWYPVPLSGCVNPMSFRGPGCGSGVFAALADFFERAEVAIRFAFGEGIFYSFAVAAKIDGVEDCERAADTPHKADAEADQRRRAKVDHVVILRS